MIGYFLPIGDSGGWLIRPDPQNHALWQLVLLGPDDKNQVVNTFEFPHLAAHALATFQTGNSDWDSIPQIMPALVPKYAEQGLHDLKKWIRHKI